MDEKHEVLRVAKVIEDEKEGRLYKLIPTSYLGRWDLDEDTLLEVIPPKTKENK